LKLGVEERKQDKERERTKMENEKFCREMENEKFCREMVDFMGHRVKRAPCISIKWVLTFSKEQHIWKQ